MTTVSSAAGVGEGWVGTAGVEVGSAVANLSLPRRYLIIGMMRCFCIFRKHLYTFRHRNFILTPSYTGARL